MTPDKVPSGSRDARIQDQTPDHLSDVARLAYIYGLPAYELARIRYRAFSRPRRPLRLNTFRHSRALATPKTSGVTGANCDTLTSRAWIDLSRGPLLIRVPEAADRYFSLALIDFFTNIFAVLGPRSMSGTAGDFLLAGSQWDGETGGMRVLRSPTNAVWASARTLVHGADDLVAGHAVQNMFSISRYGEPSERARPRHPRSLPVEEFDPAEKPLRFFDVLNAVLGENPPPPRDKIILDRLGTIGVGPSLKFNRGDFTQPQLKALRQGLAAGRNTIREQVRFRTSAAPQPARKWPSDALLDELAATLDPSWPRYQDGRPPGWSTTPGPARAGDFGKDYLSRAQCALASLGALPREEAMYFSTATDGDGAMLNGGNNYVLSFPAARFPPADAFWSLTIYQSDGNNRRWLAPNAIDRYSVGSRKPDLHHNADGSLDVFIQHERPDRLQQNWLPAPEKEFVIVLRAYRPRPELLEGLYVVPGVRRTKS
jgi:hypothetical protein